MKITIAAINLQSGVKTTRGYWHFALSSWKYWLPHSDRAVKLAGNLLAQENADIACITEISEKSLCTGFQSQLEILGRSAEMQQRDFFSSKIPFAWFRDEGNAILTKHQTSARRSHPLSKELFNCSIDESTIEINGRKITAFVAHLALSKKCREIQVAEIAQILKGRTGPIILAGDFNERDPEALNTWLTETPLRHMCTLPTFPSWKPKWPLDYIFLSGEFSAIECYTPKSPAFSDHAALLVKAELN
jgi:endonuclease/exonuclease/phosphatase family metal-dependent hydrolase